jgi:branched-chain amino acid transport system permease protein
MDITRFISTHRKLLVAGLLLVILIAVGTLPLYGPLLGMVTSELFIPALPLMYTALAVSWTMFSGSTGYMSLAPAAFMGIGIYFTGFLWNKFPLGVIILIAAALSFVVALLLGLVTLRLRGIYFAIFSFGLVVLFGRLAAYYDIHVVGIKGRAIPPVSWEMFYYMMLGMAVATLIAVYFIRRSRLGLAMQSIGGNEEAAAHMGVNTTMVKVITFAISSVFMGVTGALFATHMVFIDPYGAFSLEYSFTPVLMAIFGGMGALYGPVVGATIFSLFGYWLQTNFPIYYGLIFGIVLILAILYLPGGLVGLVPKLQDRLGGPLSKLGKGGRAEQHANT